MYFYMNYSSMVIIYDIGPQSFRFALLKVVKSLVLSSMKPSRMRNYGEPSP